MSFSCKDKDRWEGPAFITATGQDAEPEFNTRQQTRVEEQFVCLLFCFVFFLHEYKEALIVLEAFNLLQSQAPTDKR